MKMDEISLPEKIIFYFSGGALIIMTLIVAINSISRYFFNSPLMIVEEVATTMFVWLIFTGASICYKQKMHIGIECFVGLLPQKIQKIIAIIVDIILIIANVVLVILSLKLTISAWSKLTPVLGIPYTFIDISAFFGFAFMLVFSIEFIISDIKSLNDKDNNQIKEV